ncbi:MAG: GLUG motif-containing protein, partial [Phycisphaerales bacterium]
MRRMTAILLILVWCVAGPTRAVDFAGGTGEPNDPCRIATAEQLNAIGASSQWWGKHFRLIADIDLSAYRGTEFHPLGYWRSDKDNVPFTGVFDGGGHSISNFQWRCLDRSYVGLFGYVSGPSAAIRNLTLVDARVNVREGGNVACLVGYLRGGTLMACSTRECEVVVQAGTNIGSLAGWVQDANSFDCTVHDDIVQVAKGSCIGSMAGNIQTSKFERCRVEGATVWSVEGTEIGGLAGRCEGSTLTDCHATADVAGAANVGGLAGTCRSVITDCSAGGSAQGNTCVGGLMGKDLAGGSRGGPAIVSKIARCFAETEVVGGSSVGGLLGSNSYMSIESCCASGSVAGGDLVGGLVGKNDAAIVNCYATGSVTGSNFGSVGGLVGRNDRTITNCYSAGNVSAGRNGGLVGRCENPKDVVACFWDLQTSGQTASEGGLGKTTTQMHLANTFLVWATGGNEGVWTIDDGVDYPRLWWEKRAGEVIRMASLSGTGTPDDPYLIYTAEEFNRVGAMTPDLGRCFRLMADIDLADFNEVVINLVGSKAAPFRGVFDG